MIVHQLLQNHVFFIDLSLLLRFTNIWNVFLTFRYFFRHVVSDIKMIHVFELNSLVNSTKNILVLVPETWICDGLQKEVGFPLRPLFKSNIFGQIGTESILTCLFLVSTHQFYMKNVMKFKHVH